MNNFFFHFKFRLKKYLNKLGISFADRALMVPKMTYREVCFFTDYLTENLSALYLESGSGGSTLIANFLGFKFHSYETSEGYTAYMNQPVIIFLDGRCRVLTALHIHANLSGEDSVLVHDFTRLKYQDILQAYQIIDQADSLVLLQKKTIANDVLQQLKKKYDLDIE